MRAVFAFFLWCGLILTFSKGALLAVPIVAVAARPKTAIPLVVIGIAAYAMLLPLNPYLIERVYGPVTGNPIGVEYKTAWNRLQQRPDAGDVIPVEIRNTGITTLRSGGWWRSALAYRWWKPDTESFIPTSPIVTSLPNDLHRGETVRRHVFELEHRMHAEPAVLIAGRVAAQNFADARGMELAGIDGVEDAPERVGWRTGALA